MADIAPGFGTQKMAPFTGRGDIDPTESEFSGGVNIGAVLRIPLAIIASNGDILVFSEYRPGVNDYQCKGILMKRSTNGGASFGAQKLIFYRSDYASDSAWMNLGVIVKNQNGRLIILFTYSDGAHGFQVTTLKKIHSDDDGLTWSPGQTSATDITTGLKKVNNAGLSATLQAVYDKTDAAWGWYMFAVGKGYCDPTSGQLIVPCNHRYTADQAGDSWVHCVISNDDGDNWVLGGGVQESVAQNEATNEMSIVRLPTGDYYANARVVSGGTLSSTQRAQTTITTAQLTSTWPQVTAVSDSGGSLSFSESQGETILDAAGNLWLTCPCNSGGRTSMRVYKSTDNGATFTSRMLNYGTAGYSALLESTANNFLCVHEATDDVENSGTTDNLSSQQMLRIARFSSDWFSNESTYPGVATYYLNDGVSGDATYTAGTEINCWEGYGPPGKGGAGASWDANGVVLAGSGAGIQVQSIQAGSYGGMWDAGLGSITYEWIVKFDTTAATWTLFDNRANSGRGFTVQINAGVVSATMSDGTTARTAGSGTAVSGSSVYHNIAVVLNRGVTLRVYVDGVLNSTISDTMSGTTGIVGTAIARVGSLTGGTSPAPASTSLRMMRVTHKALSSFMAIDVVKPSLSTLSGFVATANTALPAVSNLKLAMFAPQFGQPGVYGSQDRYGGIQWPYSTPINGTQISSYKERSSLNRLWKNTSQFRSTYWDTDSQFGRHVRVSRGSATTAVDFWRRAATTTDYDFWQNTGIGTFICAFNMPSSAYATTKAIFDNNNATSANPGFSIYVNDSTNLVQVRMTHSTAYQYDQAMSGGISYNQWYFLAVVFNGRGVAPTGYKNAYSNGSVTVSGSAMTNTWGAGVDGTYASTQIPTIAGRPDSNRGPDIRLGPVLMFNTALTPTEVAAWGAVLNRGPSFPLVGSSRIRLGVGLGL